MHRNRSWSMRRSVYDSVTGRSGHKPLPNNSVNAVRNLVEFVKVEEMPFKNEFMLSQIREANSSDQDLDDLSSNESINFDKDKSRGSHEEELSGEGFLPNISYNSTESSSDVNLKGYVKIPQSGQHGMRRSITVSQEETASRLGEGTIRALRDIALDEALELHQCLRFWTQRWERPSLYYLEFAPRLLFSKNEGHFTAGQNVSQLQAVLARRCSSIGELQQHLWRAGWQSGIAQWGVLGQEFAAVIGGQGIDEQNRQSSASIAGESTSSFFRSIGHDRKKVRDSMSKAGGSDYYIDSFLYVKKKKGGEIVQNSSAMAAWSIDALRVVRDQLYNAGNVIAPLPSYKNWPTENEYFHGKNGQDRKPRLGDSMMSIDGATSLFDDDKGQNFDLPLWATCDVECDNDLKMTNKAESENLGETIVSLPETGHENEDKSMAQKGFIIKDIQMMADEVSGILNSMESYMEIQRTRRLEKLKPPSHISRQWYMIVLVVPITGYFAYQLTKGNATSRLASEVCAKVCTFFAEHVSEPLESIYRELFTRRGREEITDRKARQEVISSLKKMIKSWLDDVHPEMTEASRSEMAQSMEMSLIEKTKEISIQNILEISSIYRLSLIEMQFIKKEMMNALYAMDELMGSNEINVRLAAMTPAFLLFSSFRYVMKKIYYVFFKLGKSKEEVYASFRHLILDIERLLVMRDNPPLSPPPLATGVQYYGDKSITGERNKTSLVSPNHTTIEDNYQQSQSTRQNVLSADDLGMLMLLVHECRIILWKDRRRFTRQDLRNVNEDLAELAGERGAVSVQQQLRIIARMCRTYSFLKVISSGIPFLVEDSSIVI
mmetsp:Transcript_14324/g.21697  ORF Transcript_14324/g.21697 Transcript_14324/m.21697 type:complete len:833 (+) Transcript_14324:561-3059(+)